MSWIDRLQTASYTASNNVEIEFEYEDVSQAFTNKGTTFNFPNGTATYVQRSGYSSLRFPLECYFHGDDYDLEADAFMSLLRVGGVGKLQHPIYGTINVVPLGEITREDALKTGGNQTKISVSFLETSAVVFPSSRTDPEAEVQAKILQYQTSGAGEFNERLDLSTVEKSVTFENNYLATLDISQSAMEPVVSTSPALLNQFNTIYDSISLNMNQLLLRPDVLASQTMTFLNVMSFSPAQINSRLAGYRTLINLIVSNQPTTENDLSNQSLFAQTNVIGCVSAVVETEFETQPDALDAAVFILDLFQVVNDWYDEALSSLGVIDTGGTYEALQDAVAIAAGFLIEISFTLKQERFLTLSEPRTLVDLVYELYGELDEQYDFFINSNNLTGSEIIQIPSGRTLRYYV